MTTQRTTQDAAEIFDGFVDQLKDIVKNGEKVVTDEGEEKRKTPSPATLNVIRQFLRDQNITASPAHKGVQALAQAEATRLPFEVDEDGNERPTAH